MEDLESRRFDAALEIIGEDKFLQTLPRVILAHITMGKKKEPNQIRYDVRTILSIQEERLRRKGVSEARFEKVREVTLELIERWIDDEDGVMEEMKDREAFRG